MADTNPPPTSPGGPSSHRRRSSIAPLCWVSRGHEVIEADHVHSYSLTLDEIASLELLEQWLATSHGATHFDVKVKDDVYHIRVVPYFRDRAQCHVPGRVNPFKPLPPIEPGPSQWFELDASTGSSGVDVGNDGCSTGS